MLLNVLCIYTSLLSARLQKSIPFAFSGFILLSSEAGAPCPLGEWLPKKQSCYAGPLRAVLRACDASSEGPHQARHERHLEHSRPQLCPEDPPAGEPAPSSLTRLATISLLQSDEALALIFVRVKKVGLNAAEPWVVEACANPGAFQSVTMKCEPDMTAATQIEPHLLDLSLQGAVLVLSLTSCLKDGLILIANP